MSPEPPSPAGLTPLPPTDTERLLWRLARPVLRTSAEALYALMPRQRGGQLPLVDVPYDPAREEHWAEAARVADYVAHLPEPPDSARPRVLDIGPGDGWPALPVALARPDALVVGVDPAWRRCATCASNARRLDASNTAFAAGDAARLPFGDASFDLVTAASSLEEAADPPAAFAELRRVLRPGGVLRASYQDWALDAAGWESALAWDGERLTAEGAERVLLYTYVRREQEPPLERRYTLVLPASAEAEAAHRELLLAAAAGRRAYGETLLTPALGVDAVQRLAPLASEASVVELRRWTTEWLVGALREAGFAEVRASVHPGELGRRFAREALRAGLMPAYAPLFEETTTLLGRLAGSQPGRAMVVARR